MANQTIIRDMKIDKLTSRTVRYKPVDPDLPPLCTAMYVEKWAVVQDDGTPAPIIRVAVSIPEPGTDVTKVDEEVGNVVE